MTKYQEGRYANATVKRTVKNSYNEGITKKQNLKMAIVCLLLVDQNVSSSAMLVCQLSCSLS